MMRTRGVASGRPRGYHRRAVPRLWRQCPSLRGPDRGCRSARRDRRRGDDGGAVSWLQGSPSAPSIGRDPQWPVLGQFGLGSTSTVTTDVWGDLLAVPGLEWAVQLALLQGMAGTWPDLCRSWSLEAPRIEVFRINTVVATAQGLLAFGRVGSHLPGMNIAQALAMLRQRVAESESESESKSGSTSAVRVALMHHPPHPFAAHRYGRIAGWRHCRVMFELAAVADECGIQLMIAGHRHKYVPTPTGRLYRLEASLRCARKPHNSSPTAPPSGGRDTHFRCIDSTDWATARSKCVGRFDTTGRRMVNAAQRNSAARTNRGWSTIFTGLPI